MPATLESDDIHITFLNWIFTVISGSLSPAWRVLRLWMEERSPFRRVHANILNKQSRTSYKGWSSNLGVGRGANKSSP